MNETQLHDSMRALPRATASPAFTSEVLRKARGADTPVCSEQASVPVPLIWRMAASVAMAACLVAVVSLASMQYIRRQNVAQLRAEQQKLEAELAAVRKIASAPEPVVVFEDDRGTRVIMDLDSAVQPASHQTFD